MTWMVELSNRLKITMIYVKRSSGKDAPHAQTDGKFQQRDENQKKDSSRNVINKYMASKVNIYKS